MTTREEPHRLVDQLPDHELDRIAGVLREISADVEDASGMTAEDRAWLESDLPDLAAYEPYDWGENGPPAGKPVRTLPSHRSAVLFIGVRAPGACGRWEAGRVSQGDVAMTDDDFTSAARPATTNLRIVRPPAFRGRFLE